MVEVVEVGGGYLRATLTPSSSTDGAQRDPAQRASLPKPPTRFHSSYAFPATAASFTRPVISPRSIRYANATGWLKAPPITFPCPTPISSSTRRPSVMAASNPPPNGGGKGCFAPTSPASPTTMFVYPGTGFPKIPRSPCPVLWVLA